MQDTDDGIKVGGDYDLVQNPALGAISLWAFVREFTLCTKDATGPTLPLMMLVLPIVFHQKTLESIEGRHLEKGLYLALADDRSIPVGLQERMMAMSTRTFRSIGIAVGSGLLTFDVNSAEFFPGHRTDPSGTRRSDISMMLRGAKRLGHWAASTSHEHLFSLLRVRF
ncbi:MAG: three component ABC system middle component [Ignavibacteriales bacterium]